MTYIFVPNGKGKGGIKDVGLILLLLLFNCLQHNHLKGMYNKTTEKHKEQAMHLKQSKSQTPMANTYLSTWEILSVRWGCPRYSLAFNSALKGVLFHAGGK